MKHTASAHPTTLPVIVGRAPNARTVEGRQRQTLHRIVRELGYSEPEYRTMLGCLTSSRYARDLDSSELAYAIVTLNGFLDEKRRTTDAAYRIANARPVKFVSNEEAAEVLF